MWRREERLGYLLSGAQLSPKPVSISGLRAKIAHRFRLWGFPDVAEEPLLRVSLEVISPRDLLIETAAIRDGLGPLKEIVGSAATHEVESEESPCTVREANLLNGAAARTLRFPDARGARIRQVGLAIVPYFRWLRLSFQTAVRAPEYPQIKAPVFGKFDALIPANPVIRTMVSRISAIPHRRASVDVNKLKASDSEGFLRETKALKGVPTDRGELIGVFRHVPIEVISRLRYLAEEKAIIYSIANVSGRTRTRVHDLAAVRDSSSQEIHLVPHRTQFRMVFLN
jgi:hypothetical protein